MKSSSYYAAVLLITLLCGINKPALAEVKPIEDSEILIPTSLPFGEQLQRHANLLQRLSDVIAEIDKDKEIAKKQNIRRSGCGVLPWSVSARASRLDGDAVRLFSRAPAMRQKFVDAAVRPGRQTFEHILHVREDIMPVQLGRLDQAHDGRSALSGTQAASE